MITFKRMIVGSIAAVTGLTAAAVPAMAKETDTNKEVLVAETENSGMTNEEFETILKILGMDTDDLAAAEDEDSEEVSEEDPEEVSEEDSEEETAGDDILVLLEALQDPDARTELAAVLLEGSGLTEEEEEELLTYIHDFTEEDAQHLAEAFWASVEDGSLFEEIARELEAAVTEYAEEQLQEAAVELDEGLDELGTALISISADDIVNFAHALTGELIGSF